MIKKVRPVQHKWTAYQTPEEKKRITWATGVLEEKRKREHAVEVRGIEQRGTNRYYETAIRRGEKPSQSATEYETQEKETVAGREITGAKLRGTRRAVGAEVRRIVTSRKAPFDYKKIEGFVVSKPKRLRRVHLRYKPMAKNMLEAGRESNPWK
jgi:hypothetical protein